MQRVVVENNEDNWAQWGKLVKTWATGTNYLDDGNSYPLPGSLKEFHAQLAQAKVAMTIPDWVATVQFVQGDDATLVVRLPPAQMIQDSEAELHALSKSATNAQYPLPIFYDVAWHFQSRIFMADAMLMRFHCQRIGEYTINNCM
jgi:hypothetical protein